jgi:uncharacterized protein (TIGR00288 family)
MSQTTVEDVALFFDFENISISLWKQGGPKPSFKKIKTWFSQFGRVVVARAYADWSSHHTFLAPLQSNDFEPVFVDTHAGYGHATVKNACDMQIVVEATAVSFMHPHISTFGLLTGDRDFMPLVNHLRGLGKKVIVMAVQDSASVQLKKAVDLFVTYREILEQLNGRSQAIAPKSGSVFDLLVGALKQLLADGKEPVLARVKTQMDNKIGGFNPKDYQRDDGTHYGRFISFVKEAERQGYVRLGKKGNDIIVELVDRGGDKLMSGKPAFPAWSPGGMPLN